MVNAESKVRKWLAVSSFVVGALVLVLGVDIDLAYALGAFVIPLWLVVGLPMFGASLISGAFLAYRRFFWAVAVLLTVGLFPIPLLFLPFRIDYVFLALLACSAVFHLRGMAIKQHWIDAALSVTLLFLLLWWRLG